MSLLNCSVLNHSSNKTAFHWCILLTGDAGMTIQQFYEDKIICELQKQGVVNEIQLKFAFLGKSKDSLHRIHLWLSLDSAIQLFGPFLRYLTCDKRHEPLCSSAMNGAYGGYFTLNSSLLRKSGPICKQQLTTFHLPVVLSCEIWGSLDEWMTYTPENCCVKTQLRSCIVQQNTVQYTYIMQRFQRTVSTVRMYSQASDAQNIVCVFSAWILVVMFV